MSEQVLRTILAEAGLRTTRPRLALLRVLHDHAEALDAMQMHQWLHGQGTRVSLGTIYRTLRELERQALVDVSVTPHGRIRWRLCAGRLALSSSSLPASPAAASLPGSHAVAALAEQAARLGYHLVPIAPTTERRIPQDTR